MRRTGNHREGERGVTLALVALGMFGIIAMAALSIDIGTLYQASAEAQRAADGAALTAARVLSMSGMTGDPTNSGLHWQAACDAATNAATSVANQNLIGGLAPSSVTVTYLSTDKSNCTTAGAFGVNPMVTVKVSQIGLPTFFARIWTRAGSTVSATATAEAFNPSASETFTGADLIPVAPRCVKPWIVPNVNPIGGLPTFVATADGAIQNAGIRVNGGIIGVIGETFNLVAQCSATGTACNGPGWSGIPSVSVNNLPYFPGQVLGTPVGVASGANGDPYQQAIGGCDQTTPYQCGVPASNATSASEVDLNENPITSNDTSTAVQALIYQSAGAPDSLDTTVYPYEIRAGLGNPLGVNGKVITSSNSIVTLPIYDGAPLQPNAANQAPVTIVGFLQVFLGQIGGATSVPVTVLNVAGCGNGQNTTVVSGTPVYGTSPVPVRLITSP